MKLRLRDALALTTTGYLLSVCSKILSPGFYTDILAIFYRSVLPSNNGIPYHAYWLEYPAIPAIMVWVSGLTLNAQYYMWTMAALMYPFALGSTYYLYRTCTEFGMDRGRIVPFFLMAPSFLVMSFFNWDIVAVATVNAAIYFALKKNPRLVGLCLGLGFAAKNYPLLLLPAFLKHEQSWNDRFDTFLATIFGGLIPNLPFILVDFPAWLNSLLSRQVVYVEDSIWMVIRYYGLINQDWLVNVVVWSLIVLGILHITFSKNTLVLKAWVIVAITTLIFPAYPPQYNLWLLPLFVLNPVFALIPFLAFDFLNSTIILSWFTVADPFQPWGPIWDISLVRIAMLLMFLVLAVHRGSIGVNSHSEGRSRA